jgi:hypothetical protein
MSKAKHKSDRPDARQFHADIVDLNGVAEMFGNKIATSYVWKSKGMLPPVDYPELSFPVWNRDTIVRWAGETRRIVINRPDAA